MSSGVPAIGSAAWDAELAEWGVPRAAVDALLLRALRETQRSGRDPTNAHEVDSALAHIDLDVFGETSEDPGVQSIAQFVKAHPKGSQGRSALMAVFWVLFHRSHPSYAALMYLRINAWHRAHVRLKHWITRQLAAMLLHGPDEVRESAWYGLGVDYFEDAEDATLVFPDMAELLRESLLEELFQRSADIAWEAKRGLYERLARDPKQHTAVAKKLLDSTVSSGFYGSVDAKEGLALVRRLHDADRALREELETTLATPIRARVVGLMLPAPHDSAWNDRGEFLVALEFRTQEFMWNCGTEIWVGGALCGHLLCSEYWNLRDIPKPRPKFRRYLVPGRPSKIFTWHRVRVPPSRARALLGREVELWPPSVRTAVLRAKRREEREASTGP